MDSLTHTLVGAVIAKAIDDKKVGNWGAVTGLAMGIFPDSDFVLSLFNRQFYLQYHRDFTHSLILIPFYSLLFAWLFVKLSKRAQFWAFYKICLLVLVSHVILDLLTSYGTMIFSPLWNRRFSGDLLFIIDLVFSGLVFVPLLTSLLLRRRARWICRGSVIALTLYVLFCWIQHGRALNVAEKFARSLKEDVIQVASLPQPVSPFRWANYIETKQKVYQGFVDFLKADPPSSLPGISTFEKLNRLYWPPGLVEYRSWQKLVDSPWVEKALATKGVKFYYWFARFPVVKSVNSRDGSHRVEFSDVRFLLPGLRMPFVYYIEFDESGQIRSEGFLQS